MKVSYKLATVLANILFAAAGIFVLRMTGDFPETFGIGPAYFPKVLSMLLIGFALYSTVVALLGEGGHIALPRPGNILFVILSGVLFIFLWLRFQLFYVSSFCVVVMMLLFLNPEKSIPIRIFAALAAGAVITLFVFLVFGRILNFRF
jgi:hypothetical protein